MKNTTTRRQTISSSAPSLLLNESFVSFVRVVWTLLSRWGCSQVQVGLDVFGVFISHGRFLLIFLLRGSEASSEEQLVNVNAGENQPSVLMEKK